MNSNWYDPKDDQVSSQDAAERAMQFLGKKEKSEPLC